ncbi:MAG: LAGLIDADG family homing endonuclease [Nanoarchaeota archaeon]|nr:LAGLIDADG family homing endonuclease [Nanoarchaeota archaeon]
MKNKEVIKMYKHLLTNPKLARLVADLTSDGHLQIQGHRHIASFYSKSISEIKSVERKFIELFNIKGKLYLDQRPVGKNPNPIKRYKIFFISKPISIFLRDIGTPVGNKTNNPFEVPNWIFKGNPNLKIAYLKGLYDAEGSIFCIKNKRWRMSLRMAKNKEILDSGIKYFEQIRSMLKEFKIKSSPVRCYKLNIRKDGSISYNVHIDIEKSSFRNFLKYVGFDHPEKRKKLLYALRVSGKAANAAPCRGADRGN